MSDAIDTTAVEDHPDAPDPTPATGTAVARRERRSEVVKPLNTDDLIDGMQAYQALLPRLLTDNDYQAADGKRFVKKSGWRKIATAFDLDVQILRSLVDRDEGGQPLRAEVWARAIAPSGRVMDGDGYCALSEFKGRRGNDSKLENTMRATATTRAMNRAISGLVGMGEVSAEEVDAAGGQAQAAPHGAAAAGDAVPAASTALVELCGGDVDAARSRWEAIRRELGYMPVAAAVALRVAAQPLGVTVEQVAEAFDAEDVTDVEGAA